MKPAHSLPCFALLLTICIATPAKAGISGMAASAATVDSPNAAKPDTPAQQIAGPSPAGVRAEDLKRCYDIASNEDKLRCYLTLTIRALPVPHPTTNTADNTTDNLTRAAQPHRSAATHATTSQNPAAPSAGESERSKDSQKFIELRKIILDHQEPSYFNFSSGVRLGSDRASANLLYEAQIVKNVSITDSAQIKDYSHFFWIDAPVRIGVRQETGPSLPVRTPSFNPGLRLTWAPRLQNNYFSAGLHHYSNGQDAKSTFDDDGRVNTQNGSFNTNYIELAAQNHDFSHPLEKDGYQNWYQIAFRQHLYGTFEPFQHGQYPRQQLIFGVHHTRKSFHLPLIGYEIKEVQLRLTSTLGLGYQYAIKNDRQPEQNRRLQWHDRINTRLELIGLPKESEELGLYLRYDYGYDYYNINFQRRINRFQIGVAALIR